MAAILTNIADRIEASAVRVDDEVKSAADSGTKLAALRDLLKAL